MKRKNFISNCLMALAISLLPKSLLPSSAIIEIEPDEPTNEYTIGIVAYIYSEDGFERKEMLSSFTIQMTEKKHALLQEMVLLDSNVTPNV